MSRIVKDQTERIRSVYANHEPTSHHIGSQSPHNLQPSDSARHPSGSVLPNIEMGDVVESGVAARRCRRGCHGIPIASSVPMTQSIGIKGVMT